jgi:ribulose-phosphate 3-epimerase
LPSEAFVRCNNNFYNILPKIPRFCGVFLLIFTKNRKIEKSVDLNPKILYNIYVSNFCVRETTKLSCFAADVYFTGKADLYPLVSPSVLAADMSKLGGEIASVTDSGHGWVHFDVCDGSFVSNITFGIPVVAACRRHAPEAVFDVHLMIIKPERYISDFAEAGADIITVHYEACEDTRRALEMIHSHGKKAGVSIKPSTPVEVLFELLDIADLFLIMSVEPGFGGQAFMEEAPGRIKALTEKIAQGKRFIPVSVDGGINAETAAVCRAAGISVLVAGSYVFNAQDRTAAMKSLISR